MDELTLAVEQLQEVVINLHKRLERLERQTLLHDYLPSEFGGYLPQVATKNCGPDDLLDVDELYDIVKDLIRES